MVSEATQLGVDEFTRWFRETGDYELRQILHWKWDPIGVSGAFPYAADEYDSYCPQIVAVLSKGASTNEIAELLAGIEHERMGLGEGSLDRLNALGAVILTWFVSSQIRWTESGPLRR